MQLAATSRPDLRTRPARERILLTAHDLFYRQGIRSTGIDTVIARAGRVRRSGLEVAGSCMTAL